MKNDARSTHAIMQAVTAYALLGLACLGSAPAMASTYDFYRITNNASVDIGGQLSMDVSAQGADSVLFTFHNNIGTQSSITDIYFDLGPAAGLITSMQVHDDSGSGVWFDNSARPRNLPGGNTLNPQFQADYSGDSGSFFGFGVAYWGVNTNQEWVSFVGKLGDGKSLDGVLTALGNRDFRVGLHVQAIAPSGDSDSYINNHTNIDNVSAVPLPAAGWLFGSALVGFMMLSTRTKI